MINSFFGNWEETEEGINAERKKIQTLIDNKAEAENPYAVEYLNEASLKIK